MTIKEFAARTGLTAHTLRYYEKMGLMRNVARSNSGQRRYNEEDVNWVGLIQCFKATGMPLKELQRFVELERCGDVTASERLVLLRRHEQNVQAERVELDRQHTKLLAKIAHHEQIISKKT